MAGVKMTGAEYMAFTTTPWGPDWYWDDTIFLHNGEEKDDIGEVEPTDTIVIVEGTIHEGQDFNSPTRSALTFARKWLKEQSHAYLTVCVPKNQLDAFKAEMKGRGLKVL